MPLTAPRVFRAVAEQGNFTAAACAAAGSLCTRLRRRPEPVWGLRLPPVDYARNDLNLSDILTAGERVTGVVDRDEFGLGSRALDLIASAMDRRSERPPLQNRCTTARSPIHGGCTAAGGPIRSPDILRRAPFRTRRGVPRDHHTR